MARYTKTGTLHTIGQIDSNLDLIATAIGDTLSRKGDSPNQMESSLDMNSQRILNLPTPLTAVEPLRLGDVPSLSEFQSLLASTQSAKNTAVTAEATATSASNSATVSAATATFAKIGAIEAKDLAVAASIIQYQTFAELLAISETVDYKQFTVAERANAAYTLQPSGYVALAGDATLLNGRVAQLQTSGYKNARFYGATGDGVTDDTTAMQLAISSLLQFESLHIPSGTYKISSTLTLSAWRTSIYGDGMSTRLRRSADGFDILHVTPSNPASGVVSYFSLSDMELSGEGITNNTSGNGLRLTQLFRSLISNLHINGNYGGVLVEGCNSVHLNSLEIYADQNFNAEFKANSYLMKFVKQPLTSGVQLPSGIFIESLQARGSVGNGYLDKGIVIQAADNLWFNNTHIGILAGDAVYINPQDANDSMFGINFKATHFDGGAASGSIMQNCVNYDIGPSVPDSKIKGHSYVGCQFSNVLNDGFKCNATDQLKVSDVVISDGRFNNIEGWGVNIDDGSRYVISDSTFYDMTNSSGCITIKDADFVKVDSIFGESPVGIQTTGNATRLLVNGIWQNVTEDVIISTGNSSKQINGLTNSGSNVVASASDLSLKFPHDTFQITGVVTIDTINADSIADNRTVTLVFGGVCAVANSAILLSSAFTSTANSTLSLKYNAGNWIEISRSIR